MSFPSYPKYKPSGVEWLAEVPESWEVRRIKHLGKTITGGTPKTEEPEYWTDGDVPWLPSGKVQNNSVHKEDADTFITKRALAESAAKLIRPGSALIALTGATCANAAFLTFESTANQSVVGIEPKLNADGRFIYYSLLSQREQVLTHKSGGAQGGINQEDVRNLVITAPEKAEQTAIAEFLDRETGKIDGLVAEQRRLMELLKEKRQAVISHAVTKGLNPHAPMKPSGIEWLGDVPDHWEVGPVKRYFKSCNTRRIPLSGEERGGRSGVYPYYGASGIIDHIDEFIFDEDLVLVSEDGANLLNRASPIAFVAVGKYWVNNHAHILRPIDSNLLFWAARIESIDITPFVTGSAQPKFTSEALGALIISVPPAEEERVQIQSHILTETAKFDALTAEAQRAIDLLQERRTALISAAVTGQIDVRESVV